MSHSEEKQDTGQQIQPKGMQITDAAAGQKFVCQKPGPRNQPSDCGKELRVPIKKGIENIDDDVAEGAAIIDGGLSALRAPAATQFCAAVFAMCQRQSPSVFPPKKALSTRFFDRGDRGITQDNLCRFVRHPAASLK